jgi:CheY-like chemotaxis protein
MTSADPILLVEDDGDTRRLLSSLLSNAGYPIITADDGQQAIDLLASGVRPRLLIVDLVLPKVPGEDVVRFAHEDPALRHAPVVVISGMPRANIKVIADAIISKPFRLAEVAETVDRLLAKSIR